MAHQWFAGIQGCRWASVHLPEGGRIIILSAPFGHVYTVPHPRINLYEGTSLFTLVSHNAFWFQGTPYADDLPAAPATAVLDGLATLYRVLDPDMLCLQEIQDPAACHAIAHATGMEAHFCAGGAYAQYGGTILSRHGSYVASSANDAQAPPQRFWQIHTYPVRHRNPLRVCNLHLASHRQLGPDAASRSRTDDLLQMLNHGPMPDIVAGDFNEGPEGPSNALMREQGYVDTADLTGCTITSTGVGKGRSDQIWVNQALAPCVASFRILPWEQLLCDISGITHLSDHLPLVLQIIEE